MQSPAREALTLIGPSRRPDPTPSTAHAMSPAAPPPGHEPPPRRPHPQAHRPGADAPKRPPVKIPDAQEPIRPEAPKNADMCALGRKYGGWPADSQESRICEQTYGQ